MFEAKRTDKKLGELFSSGARMDGLLNINHNGFMGSQISLPSIEEQQKIASFFKRFEKKINIEKNKLKKLENQKQRFIQQMFI